MGYFDSAKNKALWEKELSSLRGERDRRKIEGYKPQKEKEAEKAVEKNPYRRKITLKELEEIEKRESGRTREAKTAKPHRERGMEKQAPQLEAPTNAS